jgi:oligopeptide/dipeptide ABC transporter ATP-binding protein
MSEKILEVKNLTTYFKTDKGMVTAVNDVSFDVYKGKTLALVGESGSGKSVTALSLMRLIPNPPGIIDPKSQILLNGKNILDMSDSQMRSIRGNKISMIFQEPMTSLNPVYTVGNQIEEVIKLHNQGLSRKEIKDKSIEMMKLVGIPSPEKRVNDYPHQLSGGMRQRVMIAIALSCRPEVLIADEPTTALDVTIQAQILDLMKKLQDELGMGIIMITHDLGVVAETCHDVAVMYCGKIIEKADIKTLFQNPKHPYTQGLLNSIPSFDSTTSKERGKLPTIDGIVPSLFNLPQGCSFQDRCLHVKEDCRGAKGYPTLAQVEGSHSVSCFHPLEK